MLSVGNKVYAQKFKQQTLKREILTVASKARVAQIYTTPSVEDSTARVSHILTNSSIF
jgi:hypothetical protein